MASAGTLNFVQLQNLLFKEVLNTVQTYFEIKIISVESTSLFVFLSDRVHELFHYFVKQAQCCSTTTPCGSIAKQGTLTKDQFWLLFENDPSIPPTHEQRNKGKISRHCICPILPNRATDVTSLDFTLINCLIKTCRRTPAGHPQWLKDIIEVRNHLSHPGDLSGISDQEMQDWWMKLEHAAVNMASTLGVAYQKGVQNRISEMKTSQSQLEELMEALKTRDDGLVNKIVGALQNLGVKVGEVPFQITATEIVKERPQINLASSVSLPDQESKRCIVVWTFSNPGDWNVDKMKEKLELLKRLGDFDIEFVYKGSLVMYTQADVNILSDERRLKDAIEECLFLFVQFLKIQSTSSANVDVAISIWLPSGEVEKLAEEGCEIKPVADLKDMQSSLAFTAEEDGIHRETVTKPIRVKTQISADLSTKGVEFHGEMGTKFITEETQTNSALSTKEEEYHREAATESTEEETQNRSALPVEEGEINTETVTESIKSGTQTGMTLSTKEEECLRKTVTTSSKEGIQICSALLAEEPADTTHAQVPVKQSQLPRELKKIKQIDILGWFYDCTAVDDKFVITNSQNKRLVITDSDVSNVRDVPLSGAPFRITAIDNTTVAVNIGTNSIDIINIYSGDCIRTISVDGDILGLTYSEAHLYIGVDGKGIQVIDLHGNTIKTIPTERNAYRMTINKQRIYYCYGDTVACVKPSGEKIWTFKDPMIKDIRGLRTDDTNIYVTCYTSHSVYVISPDGKQVRKLLSESDGLKKPNGICYNRKFKTLMVCNWNGPAYLFDIVK